MDVNERFLFFARIFENLECNKLNPIGVQNHNIKHCIGIRC